MQLSYKKHGNNGDFILLVHGFMCDSSIFDPLIPLLTPYFQIITIDLPGYRGANFSDEYFTIESQAKLIHLLLKDLKINKVHYVGHSMGGYIGLEFLKNYSKYLHSFCLLNSHPFTDATEKSTKRQKTIALIDKYGSTPYIKESFKTLFSENFRNMNADKIEALISKAKSFPAKTLIDSCKAMIARADHSYTLKNTNVTLLYFIGNMDSLIDIYTNQKTINLNPNAIYFYSKNCGHMGMLEATIELSNFLVNNYKNNV